MFARGKFRGVARSYFPLEPPFSATTTERTRYSNECSRLSQTLDLSNDSIDERRRCAEHRQRATDVVGLDSVFRGLGNDAKDVGEDLAGLSLNRIISHRHLRFSLTQNLPYVAQPRSGAHARTFACLLLRRCARLGVGRLPASQHACLSQRGVRPAVTKSATNVSGAIVVIPSRCERQNEDSTHK